jgi:hypothetical protein
MGKYKFKKGDIVRYWISKNENVVCEVLKLNRVINETYDLKSIIKGETYSKINPDKIEDFIK